MSDISERALASLINDAATAKKNAQDVGAFLKSGKIKRFLVPATEMINPDAFITGFSFTYDRNVYFKLAVKELTGFTDSRLEGILNQFEYLNPTDTTATESAGQLLKSFRFDYKVVHGEGYLTVIVEVDAYVKTDSPTCRKEIVGYTKPSEPAPIYKIVCDDGADTPVLTTEREPIDPLADDVLTQDDVGG